jgi:hypothetical protein
LKVQYWNVYRTLGIQLRVLYCNIVWFFETRDSSSHNESTVVHDKTDVEYGDQSTVMCSSTSSETSDCLKSSKNIKNTDSLLMVDFLSSAFSLWIGKDVYSKNTGMKIVQCDNFVSMLF